MSQPKEKSQRYHYDPSYAANIIFVVLFAIPALAHIFLLVKRRTWYFIPFVVGCFFEAIGYGGRVGSAKETPNWTMAPFLVQTLLILLGPALYAASIYMVLGRLIRLLDAEKHSLIRAKWLTKIFVLGDVLSFLTQCTGGGLLAKADTKDEQDLGRNVVLAGLGIQVVFFGLFIITTVLFHVRISKEPTSRSLAVTTPWRRLLVALYVSSAMILVRSIFRMIEFGMGNNSVLMQSEAYLFVFDGLLMFLTSAIFLAYHPGTILVGYKDMSLESGTDGFRLATGRGARRGARKSKPDSGSATPGSYQDTRYAGEY